MRIWGIDIARGFIVLYNDEKGLYVYADSPEIKKKAGATYLTTKITKTGKGKRGKRTSTKRINVKGAVWIDDLSAVLQAGDVAIIERTGANGLRYATLLQAIGVKIYVIDGKQFRRWRQGRSPNKTDSIDAKALYRYGKLYMQKSDMTTYTLYEINEDEVTLRHLVNEYRRADADLTRHLNRLKDKLVWLFPTRDWAFYEKRKFLRHLPKIKEAAAQLEGWKAQTLLRDIQAVEDAAAYLEYLKAEMERICTEKYPEAWEILSTYPQLSTAQRVAILAYGGIRAYTGQIQSRNAYTGYMLEGGIREQSGSGDNEKKDKVRKEIKHLFHQLYLSAHQRKSPYRPIVENYKKHPYSRMSRVFKVRYFKFLDKLLELTRISLKYRIGFKDAVFKRYMDTLDYINRLKRKAGENFENLTPGQVSALYGALWTLRMYAALGDIAIKEDINKIWEELSKAEV